jgi:uncharacterized protein YndB with AHSA1/START domain
MQLGTSFDTRADPATAFAYLADFAHIVEWDPFIVRADRLEDGEPRVGSGYRIIGRVVGHEIALDYRTVALDPPRRIRLEGRAGRTFDGWDQMTLTPAASGGTTIRYDAEVRLHGPARLLWLLAPMAYLAMRVGFRGGPLAGLQRCLDSLAPG